MLRVPPVVLITVHGEGTRWSGRREESRGDPRCSGTVAEGGAHSPVLTGNDGPGSSRAVIALPLCSPVYRT